MVVVAAEMQKSWTVLRKQPQDRGTIVRRHIKFAAAAAAAAAS